MRKRSLGFVVAATLAAACTGEPRTNGPAAVLGPGDYVQPLHPPDLAVSILVPVAGGGRVPSGTTLLPNQTCEFDMVVSGGTPPYSYQWYVNDSLLSDETQSILSWPVGNTWFTVSGWVIDSANGYGGGSFQVHTDSKGNSCQM